MTTDHVHKPQTEPASAHTRFQVTWLSQARAGATALSAAVTPTLMAGTAQAATVQVVNIDDPGMGFDDPPPAAPVGGERGTTAGAQRRFVFEAAAKF